MNLKFIVNDYILIWNLLFRASVSENIHNIKQKIWFNYKKEYNETLNDLPLILKDPKNFIPKDDIIYNIVSELEEYELIKKDTEKFRVELLKIWDQNKKKAQVELNSILKTDSKTYDVLVVYDKLNVIDTVDKEDLKKRFIICGKKIDANIPYITIIEMIFKIIKKEFREYKTEYKDIVNAVLELAILNEFASRMTGMSCYSLGDSSLKFLKKQIYPYFLMYLGIEEKNLEEHMKKDKMIFNVSRYSYERQLRKLDLYEFINFCIRNQKFIIKLDEIDII